MVAKDLIKSFESWAPTGVAWDKDNVGLQVGSAERKISNIFLCLELTPKSLEQAIKLHANFIFTHHPFLFKPIKEINLSHDPKAKLIEKLIKNDITLYSAHTNLDFTIDGVSYELAKRLKLNNIEFLANPNENQFKLVTFVPEKYLESVSESIFKAGAGIIGEYTKCSFRTEGKGTFQGSENTNPAVGKKNNFEKVDEYRFEAILDSWNLVNVTKALKEAHPYEEPAYDIYPLKNENLNFGFGAIGSLDKRMSVNEFLTFVCNSLNTNNVRYTVGKSKNIKKIAVCGGSGTDLLEYAISKKADAFVTADIKYHTFQDGENRILFIDAGHYETEVPILNVVKKKFEKLIKESGESIKVFKYKGSTNPVKFFNNKGVK